MSTHPAFHAVVPMKLEDWLIKDFAPGEGDVAVLRAASTEDWIVAKAPGDTYLALHAAGRLPHPFAEQNEAACAWVQEREWWWRTTFDAVPPAAEERLKLVFDGLDTYATIWLNGELLGDTVNLFVGQSFDVGAQLRSSGLNDILIRFTPPSTVVADKHMDTWAIIADPIKTSKRNFIRKAQFGWGWDWGPTLPTVGVWRPVRLERQRVATITAVHFQTVYFAETAVVQVRVDVEAFAASGSLLLGIDLIAPDGTLVASHMQALTGSSASEQLGFANPQLWWTPELGDQPLYRLIVSVRHNGTEVARRAQRVGLRVISLDTSEDEDEPGTNFFRFRLNGVPLFARGANWIPASSFVGALDRTDYEPLVRAAADANMNMLRVWGGGIYEHEAFYDLCDELGVLVWQDFMFACAPYPEHEPQFVESVRREAYYQIDRLRNRACLALWCGNNEGQAVHQFMDRMQGRSTPYLGDLYFADIIPAALNRRDPMTPYWPGSPYGGPAHNSMRAGDVHNWTVWHGLPPVPDATPIGGFDHSPDAVAYTRYAEDKARFVSEFGIQAAPALRTLEHWLAPEELALGLPGFLNRIKDHPQDKVDAMLLPTTGLPTTLAQYVDFTQVVQAAGLKFGIQHYRRRKPHCSGTLLWQFNDCWPGISWSLIDHDGARKPSWYAVAEAYAPVMASFVALDDGSVELWVVNDTFQPASAYASLALLTLDGGRLWDEEIGLDCPAHSSARVWQGSSEQLGHGADRVLTVRSKAFAPERHLFAPLKDLPIRETIPELTWQGEAQDEFVVTVRGTGYHLLVHLECTEAGIVFSENDFDLVPGEERRVRAITSTRLANPSFHVRSLYPARRR